MGGMQIGPALLQNPSLTRWRSRLFGLTVFVNACLLFGIQPIIAKMILPWFGGGAVVWTTSMLFFQVVLLLGYVYAHLLVTRLRGAAQAGLHVALIALTLLFLRIMPDPQWKAVAADRPTVRVLEMLAVTIGLPYFVLSTTSPLLQAWYARYETGPLPYRFFAISNLGSLLALICYPLLIEPFFGLRHQTYAWSGIYTLSALLCAAIALGGLRQGVHRRVTENQSDSSPPVAVRDLSLWILLPACSSALLLSVTNHLCQDVAPIPFLWVVPLCLYLFTFVLAFDRSRWYRRRILITLLPAALLAPVYTYWRGTWNLSTDLLVFLPALFVCCMFCHGELAGIKPGRRRLTMFYVLLSLGGAIGGFAVSISAPKLFVSYSELPIAVTLCCGLALACTYGDSLRTDTFWMLLLVGLIVFCALDVRAAGSGNRVAVRNFYGVLRVRDERTEQGMLRRLYHGKVLHGSQFQPIALLKNVTTYYSPGSGAGIAIAQWRRPGMRVAVVGLGAGTLAAYASKGDTYRFYEINPAVIDIARHEFTYLRDSVGSVDVVPGDARLSLEKESVKYDVLVVDAFSGDAIPVHLLTREAIQLYLKHLAEDGVMAFHVTNRFFDLAPEIASLAASIGQQAKLIESPGREDADILASSWVLVARAAGFHARPRLASLTRDIATSLRSWTDDHSNLLNVLRH